MQNIILTCRALGLGTTITTNHIRCEDEVRALLRLPDDVDSFAMMPIGWPIDPLRPTVSQAARRGSARGRLGQCVAR